MEEDTGYTEEDIENLRKIFSLFDKENEGMIAISDMHELMQNLGKTKKEAAAIVNVIDVNHDSKIEFNEFVQLLSSIERSLQSSDPLQEI